MDNDSIMEEHTTEYRYQPIVADEEIRVLRLEAGAFSAPLIASNFPRKIESDLDVLSPAFDGVSYCWGPYEHSRFFICDSQPLRITAVVDEMLRNLRKATKTRNLWIDASKSWVHRYCARRAGENLTLYQPGR